jgi:hypothetical protein
MSIHTARRAQWTRLPSTIRAAIAAVAAALALSGCGQDAPTVDDRTPEEIVHERAQQRWDALLAGDIERAYGFITPAYRATSSLELYRARFGSAIQWNECDRAVRGVRAGSLRGGGESELSPDSPANGEHPTDG